VSVLLKAAETDGVLSLCLNNYRGWTPLLVATECGHAEIVNALLRAGALPSPQTENVSLVLQMFVELEICVPRSGWKDSSSSCLSEWSPTVGHVIVRRRSRSFHHRYSEIVLYQLNSPHLFCLFSQDELHLMLPLKLVKLIVLVC
jgi:ankyrin repeat protein